MTVVHERMSIFISSKHFNELLNPKRIVSAANFSTETENEPHSYRYYVHTCSGELAVAMNIITYITTSISMGAFENHSKQLKFFENNKGTIITLLA